MAEQSTQLPKQLIKWAFTISAWGGIVTGVAGLIMGLDIGGLDGAAYLGAAALAFGLVTIALKRE